MRVFVLVGHQKVYNHQLDEDYYWHFNNVGVFQSKQDALSEVNVSKALNRWFYDDYEIEEFDV